MKRKYFTGFELLIGILIIWSVVYVILDSIESAHKELEHEQKIEKLEIENLQLKNELLKKEVEHMQELQKAKEKTNKDENKTNPI